jgi:hypothetical protein
MQLNSQVSVLGLCVDGHVLMHRSCLSRKSKCFTMGPTQPPIQWIKSYIPGVKWLGCEIDHSHPPSAEVKSVWTMPPLSHTSLR